MASLSHIKQLPDYDEPVATPYEQARQAFLDARLIPPVDIKMDGQIHRFSASDKAGDDAGWYVLYGDNVPSGVIGNWRTGETYNFRAQMPRPLTAIEEMQIRQRQEEARAKRSEELSKKHERAAATVAEIWEAAIPASADHGYLLRKGIQPHGARIGGDGRLIVPLHDSDGRLSSVQYIDAAGNKIYHPGGEVKGMHYQMGDVVGNETIYVAEGFATAATICEVMHGPTIAAYSANNLEPVVGNIRAQWPTAEIVIVADNDKSGTGQNYANQAAAKHGARVVLIPNEGQDANDYHASGGDLHSLLAPESLTWLMYDDELSEQPAPIRWLIKGWLQDQSLIMVHGPSGCGKTFVVLDWALHIAYKDEWNGCLVHGGPVVYLAGEGHHGLRGRVAIWKQEYGGGSRRFALSKSAKDLNTAIGLQETITEIRRLDEVPRLIVVDTLHRFLAGDENSAQDAKTMIDACALLQREFSCSVLLVHHTGVAEEAQTRARGSSAWRGALEIEISIRPQSGGIIIEQRKAKDSEMLDPVFVRLESKAINGWIDEDGAPVTSAVVSLSDKPITGKDLARSDQEEKDRAVLMDIIRFSEVELDPDGEMMITRSAMARYAKENLTKIGLSDESRIKQWLNKSKDSSYLGRLLRYGVIKETGISGQYVVQ